MDGELGPESGGEEEAAVDGELALLPGTQVQGQGQVVRVAGGGGGWSLVIDQAGPSRWPQTGFYHPSLCRN